jgi:hypothetical protein
LIKDDEKSWKAFYKLPTCKRPHVQNRHNTIHTLVL